MSGAKALSDYTTKVIVPLSETDEYYCLAWVVYVESPSGDGDDQAYLANYVTIDGDYLSSIPVSEPNGVDAISGQSTGFDFGAYDQQEKAFDITQSGTVKQVTVPVLVDKQSGKAAFLGGAKRQILCVDYTQFSENGELVSPFDEDGESFNSMDVAVYANFIRVYDYFASMGWQGPNNQGTPALLQMDYRENGEPEDNCVYVGRIGGWEAFARSRARLWFGNRHRCPRIHSLLDGHDHDHQSVC